MRGMIREAMPTDIEMIEEDVYLPAQEALKKRREKMMMKHGLLGHPEEVDETQGIL